jgi:hypothetical protein
MEVYGKRDSVRKCTKSAIAFGSVGKTLESAEVSYGAMAYGSVRKTLVESEIAYGSVAYEKRDRVLKCTEGTLPRKRA